MLVVMLRKIASCIAFKVVFVAFSFFTGSLFAPPVEASPLGSVWTEHLRNDPGGKRVLFIGNSILFTHNVPKIMASIASTPAMKVTAVFGDAYTLEDHWNQRVALNVLRSERPGWEIVILQEGTGRDMDTPAEYEKYVRLFENEARKIGARTYIVENYSDDSAHYDGRHKTMKDWSAKLKLSFIPVGTAWNELRSRHPEVNLYEPDNHHPSLQGSYLMACVYYQALFGVAPTSGLRTELGYTDRSIGSSRLFSRVATAREVQETARQAVASMEMEE